LKKGWTRKKVKGGEGGDQKTMDFEYSFILGGGNEDEGGDFNNTDIMDSPSEVVFVENNQNSKIHNIISKTRHKKKKKKAKKKEVKKGKESIEYYFGKNKGKTDDYDRDFENEENGDDGFNESKESIYEYNYSIEGNVIGGGDYEGDFEMSENKKKVKKVKKKENDKNNEWIADEKIMIECGCECYIKRGDTCTCNSFNWFDDMEKFRYEIQKYRRPPILEWGYYLKNGLEFCVINRKYAMSDSCPVIHLFGSTKEGNSVFCEVYDFKPYFYIETENELTYEKGNKLKDFLASVCQMEGILSEISIVKEESKITTHFFHDTPIKNLYKIIMLYPGGVSKLRDKIGKQRILSQIGINVTRIYEANIDFIIRYANDIDMGGTSWVKINRGTSGNGRSRCQIEVRISYKDLIVLKDKDEIPPFRIVSFDIECVNAEGHFPRPEEDAVSQICASLYDTHTRQRRSIGLTLGSCNEIEGKDIYCFKRESSLMLAWSEFLKVCDIDVLTGYNIDKFDNYYLMDRAKSLKIQYTYAQYTRIIRGLTNKDRSQTAKVFDSTFQSKAYGKKKGKKHVCSGIVNLDLLGVIQRDMKLNSYTLNNVALEVLKRQKDDVHHSEIPVLCNKSTEGRTIVLGYCFTDADLPLDIILKRKILTNLVQLSRVTGSDLQGLIEKGQTHKSKTLIMKHTKRLNMILPILTEFEKKAQDRKFIGAYVENPLCGYYGKVEDMDSIRKYMQIYIQTKIVNIFGLKKIKKDVKISYNLTKMFEKYGLGEGIGYIKETRLVHMQGNYNDDDDDDYEYDGDGRFDEKVTYEIEEFFVTPKTIENLNEWNDKGGKITEMIHDEEIQRVIDKMNINENSSKKFKVRKVTWKGDAPIVCLDFKSLYPTIIIAKNLCYTTQTTMAEIKKRGWIEEEDYIVTPTPVKHYFVTTKHRKGILPSILEGLLDDRQAVKDEIKITKDQLMKSILDGLQLALKISANSLYGFTGAGFYPNRDISEAVTAFGQVFIKLAKKLCEEKYTKAKGNILDTICVYGDTVLFFFL